MPYTTDLVPSADVLRIATAAVRIYAESHPRPTQVTRGQAADMLGVSRRTVNKLLEFGTLKLNKCGLIPVELVDQARAALGEKKMAT